jgi:hypothetical protein
MTTPSPDPRLEPEASDYDDFEELLLVETLEC